MVHFTAVIEKFNKQGEKTGWSYIAIDEAQAAVLHPGVKKSYRVKGLLDGCVIEKTAILPMGDGRFILPLNAGLRKALKKHAGAEVAVQLELDDTPLLLDAEFLDCLQDEPGAEVNFRRLPRGHQAYFSKWISSAKTVHTKGKRIAMAVTALAKGWGYGEMMRAAKTARQEGL